MRTRAQVPTAKHLSLIALLSIAVAACATFHAQTSAQTSAQTNKILTGQAAFTDYSQERPGVRRKLTVADLP